MNTQIRWLTVLTLAFLLLFTAHPLHAQEGDGAASQSSALLLEEAEAVYHANLARRADGAPPLRWNAQLTEAARWFSWDSVANRAESYCGHQDTQGNWPDVRTHNAGYKGASGAENAYCGYLSGEAAVTGWLNSPGHRANLLDPGSREVGLGYYLAPGGGRGYVTQDFGHDPAYAPVVINDEALATASNAVSLYIYDAEAGGGLQGKSPTVSMQVSNDACFTGASWESYTTEKAWTLADGAEGWRTVYVQTRDALQRTAVVQDSIYRGGELPAGALATLPLSTVRPDVTLYDLESGGLPLMQFSLGWLADDTNDTFQRWWGAGQPIDDAQAWGGTAYQLTPGDGESFAWLWDTTFPKDTPFVAYFRLKVSDNTSNREVARISVEGGGVEYGPRSLKGTDFATRDGYQEFAVPFTFHSNPADEFLLFQFWRSGEADVTFDAVAIFTAPQPVVASYTWQPPGGAWRGQGVWVRYTDGAGNFTPFVDAATTPRGLTSTVGTLAFLTGVDGATPTPTRIEITAQCVAGWQAQSAAAWLTVEAEENAILVSIDPAGLAIGQHSSEIVITPSGDEDVPALHIPVTVEVAAELAPLYLPAIQR